MSAQRHVPHAKGSRATHLYIPLTLSEDVLDAIDASLPSPFTRLEECHISLSRPLYLTSLNSDAFLRAVQNAVHHFPSFEVTLSHRTAVYWNDKKDRAFLALNVQHGFANLTALVDSLDLVLRQFGLPVYYSPPLFHVSVAATGALQPDELSPQTQQAIEANRLDVEETDSPPLVVDHLQCKIAPDCHRIPLNR